MVKGIKTAKFVTFLVLNHMDLNIVIILNLIHIFDSVILLTANAPEY